jgi:hypothetical protein
MIVNLKRTHGQVVVSGKKKTEKLIKYRKSEKK